MDRLFSFICAQTVPGEEPSGRPLALRAGYRRLAALKMHTFRVYMFRIPSCLLVILQVELDVRNQPVFP